MSPTGELELHKELFEILDCPKCKLDKGLKVTDHGTLSCAVCAQEFQMKRVDGPTGKGLLIPL